MMTATQTPPLDRQTVLAERFILTAVDRLTLVFPAIWVAQIVQIDRSQILELPFYDPLMAGIIHHNGQIIPLVATARLLKLDRVTLQERLVVVRLNDAAGKIANIGWAVDRAIGSSTRSALPAELFNSATTTSIDGMFLVDPDMIPPDLWQPRT